MILRSVPLYAEVITREAQLIAAYYQRGTRIYDLGCSTGNLGVRLCATMRGKPLELIAVDNAPPMLEICAARLADAFRKVPVVIGPQEERLPACLVTTSHDDTTGQGLAGRVAATQLAAPRRTSTGAALMAPRAAK